MEISDLLEKEMMHLQNHSDDESPKKEFASAKAKAKAKASPPELTWQRKLNHSTTPLPKEFSVRFTEILHLLPLGWRLLRHIKEEADKGTPSVVDPYHKRLLTCCHGVPLGGIGGGSIGRSFGGEFQRFQLFPKVCEDTPILPNQFSAFISRPNGCQSSTVLCSTTPTTKPKE